MVNTFSGGNINSDRNTFWGEILTGIYFFKILHRAGIHSALLHFIVGHIYLWEICITGAVTSVGLSSTGWVTSELMFYPVVVQKTDRITHIWTYRLRLSEKCRKV